MFSPLSVCFYVLDQCLCTCKFVEGLAIDQGPTILLDVL